MGTVLFILIIIFIIAFISHKEKTYVPNPNRKHKKNTKAKDSYRRYDLDNEYKGYYGEHLVLEDDK